VPATAIRPPVLLTVPEAAEYLSVSERYVRRLVTERRLRHTLVGRFVRFAPADLDDFLAAGLREPVTR